MSLILYQGTPSTICPSLTTAIRFCGNGQIYSVPRTNILGTLLPLNPSANIRS